jgi:hypothetical protein
MVVTFSASSGTITPIEVQTDEAGVARSILTPDTSQTVVHVQAGTLHASLDVLSAASLPPQIPAPPPPNPSPDPLPTLTVTIFVTPAPAGSVTSFGLATQAITQAVWTFGDGATATTSTSSTTHVYSAPGRYLVGVSITDTRGRIASTSVAVTISDPPPSPTQPIRNLDITLTPSATSVPSGGTLSFTARINNLEPGETDFVYQWNLDGDREGLAEFTSTTPTHVSAPYSTAGFITASVTVRSTSSGRSGVGIATIVVTN